jgi:hypothetical protein
MAKPHLENPRLWTYVNAVNGMRSLQLLLRIDRPNIEDIDSFKEAVAIQWRYPQTEGTFDPPDGVMGDMEAFEACLEELSESGYSFLVNIGTGVGLREWLYYTKDRLGFMKRFNQLLSGREPYPLTIEFYDDPEWQAWRQFRRAYDRAAGKPG